MLLVLTHFCAIGLGVLITLALIPKLKPKPEERPMSNKFIQVVEKIGEDVAKVVEFPLTYGGKLVALIHAGQTDLPAIVSAFDGLVKAGEGVAADAAIEITADGTNLPEYMAAAKDAVSFGSYFKTTFLPAIEQAFTDAKVAIVGTPAVVVPAAAAVADAASADAAGELQPGPGLHNTVPQ